MRERESHRARVMDGLPRGSSSADPMAAVDERMDAEAAARADVARCEAEVADARAVCSGIRHANPSHPLWGDCVELHWCDLMTWEDMARYLGVSAEHCRRCAYAALDWVDMVGIAAAREGCGQAALF